MVLLPRLRQRLEIALVTQVEEKSSAGVLERIVLSIL